MRLWLLRHAQPLVAPGMCYGASDVAADPAATGQAALAWCKVLPSGVRVISSPLQRCADLAKQICELRPDVPWCTDPRLAEMDFGRWEGRPWDQIDRAELEAWTSNFSHWRCGGAECVHDVMTRVASAWDEAQCDVRPQVWVTHAGVIRAASLLAQGLREVSRADQWPVAAPAFGTAWQVQPGAGVLDLKSQQGATAHCQHSGLRALQT